MGAGLGAAFIGAIAWALITVTTKHQIGWMALGVGLLVGLAVSFGNGGKQFQVLGALLALFGCVLGNFLSLVAFAAAENHVPLLTAFANVDGAKVIAIMWDEFLSTDILFYALAIYEGYRFSIARRTKA